MSHPVRVLIVMLFTGLAAFSTGLVLGFVLGSIVGYKQGYENNRIFTTEEMENETRNR